MTKRKRRHDVIRDLVRDNVVKTQRDLAELLVHAGYECTQATISRDVIDMGLVKSADGRYVLPEEQRLARLVSHLVEDVKYACNLVVVKTSPGAAQGVSAALDDADMHGVLGTVAGDDTIMIAAESEEAAADVARRIQGLMES
ncbi:MAG: ArgR family transcriptional regulator [Coriobacteriia bacterium]|nr:ArgR family transcriptional regulator [Coriobacteriia bacterium]